LKALEDKGSSATTPEQQTSEAPYLTTAIPFPPLKQPTENSTVQGETELLMSDVVTPPIAEKLDTRLFYN
jgi:hypothetical protein